MEKISSQNVPQADVLDQVFAMVRIIHEGHHQSYFLDVFDHISSGRQVNYYTNAAETLGLIEQQDGSGRGNNYRVTKWGVCLCDLEGHVRLDAPLNNVQIRVLRCLFEESALGQAWLQFTGTDSVCEISEGTEVSFMGEHTDVTVEKQTSNRRRNTLKRWRHKFSEVEEVL